jgi:uncharacterized protein YdeI (YjbR/CyaY-like superfamily)
MQLLAGTSHHDEVPTDMVQAFKAHPEVAEKRNHLTELARNEWICWVTIVKQDITRSEHIIRLIEEVGSGKKRPCCRP